jgi:hypothetical protein
MLFVSSIRMGISLSGLGLVLGLASDCGSRDAPGVVESKKTQHGKDKKRRVILLIRNGREEILGRSKNRERDGEKKISYPQGLGRERVLGWIWIRVGCRRRGTSSERVLQESSRLGRGLGVNASG